MDVHFGAHSLFKVEVREVALQLRDLQLAVFTKTHFKSKSNKIINIMFRKEISQFEHFQVRLLDTDLAQTEKGVTRAQLRRYLFKNTIERVFTQFRWYVFF